MFAAIFLVTDRLIILEKKKFINYHQKLKLE